MKYIFVPLIDQETTTFAYNTTIVDDDKTTTENDAYISVEFQKGIQQTVPILYL